MAKWTQATYEMVAEVLREGVYPDLTHGVLVRRDLAEAFAQRFSQDNAKFARMRFLAACGVNPVASD
jgi:hypothetical protein